SPPRHRPTGGYAATAAPAQARPPRSSRTAARRRRPGGLPRAAPSPSTPRPAPSRATPVRERRLLGARPTASAGRWRSHTHPRDHPGVGDRPKERDPAPPNDRGGPGLDADVRTPRRDEGCHMITVESLTRRYAGFTA